MDGGVEGEDQGTGERRGTTDEGRGMIDDRRGTRDENREMRASFVLTNKVSGLLSEAVVLREKDGRLSSLLILDCCP